MYKQFQKIKLQQFGITDRYNNVDQTALERMG